MRQYLNPIDFKMPGITRPGTWRVCPKVDAFCLIHRCLRSLGFLEECKAS